MWLDFAISFFFHSSLLMHWNLVCPALQAVITFLWKKWKRCATYSVEIKDLWQDFLWHMWCHNIFVPMLNACVKYQYTVKHHLMAALETSGQAVSRFGRNKRKVWYLLQPTTIACYKMIRHVYHHRHWQHHSRDQKMKIGWATWCEWKEWDTPISPWLPHLKGK